MDRATIRSASTDGFTRMPVVHSPTITITKDAVEQIFSFLMDFGSPTVQDARNLANCMTLSKEWCTICRGSFRVQGTLLMAQAIWVEQALPSSCASGNTKPTMDKASALFDLAVAHAQANQIRESEKKILMAQNLVLNIRSPIERVNGLVMYACAMVDARFNDKARLVFNDAKASANGLAFLDNESAALVHISKAQAEVGFFNAAKKTADIIPMANFKVKALAQISKAKAQAGFFDDAKEGTKAIADVGIRAIALSNIATLQSEDNKFTEAKTTLEEAKRLVLTIAYSDEQVAPLVECAKGQAEALEIDAAKETFEQAKKAALQIIDLEEKRDALISVARGQSTALEIGAAKETFEQAKKAALAVSTLYERVRGLAKIALEQINALMFNESIETFEQVKVVAQSIESPQSQGMAIAFIAKKEAAADLIEYAKATAAIIPEDYISKSYICEDITTLEAKALAARRLEDLSREVDQSLEEFDISQAKIAASCMENPLRKIKALLKILSCAREILMYAPRAM
ncbi:MAG: hypothetical protein SP4CHLAM5_09890 [Chlamydiia bacterium]|nr:hypothetical protein [Chlamydiia bacterium]MCH9624552.1 hypothetical protein [Chlamydiia bacterium]